jgi:hypothetical protein
MAWEIPDARTHGKTRPAFAFPHAPAPRFCAELRESFARWEPDLREAVKWNMLSFSGRKLVAALMGCKRHAGIIFFRGVELDDPRRLFSGGENNSAMRTVRVEKPDALDRDALRRLLRAAVALDGSEMPPMPPKKRPPMPVPGFFSAALRRDCAAREGFAQLSPSCRREYLVWLLSAKRPETRERRMRETLAALATGRKWQERARPSK